MNIEELQSQLGPNQCVTTVEDTIVVKTDDRVTSRYLIGRDSQLWLISPVSSCPPKGHYKVLNLYVDSATNKLRVEYDQS